MFGLKFGMQGLIDFTSKLLIKKNTNEFMNRLKTFNAFLLKFSSQRSAKFKMYFKNVL